MSRNYRSGYLQNPFGIRDFGGGNSGKPNAYSGTMVSGNCISKRRILAIDDEEDSLSFLTGALECHGYTVRGLAQKMQDGIDASAVRAATSTDVCHVN
jgi:hypothetical protein